jgi:ubiquinone/menaquinone biosynthesis C-methylase UbiE
MNNTFDQNSEMYANYRPWYPTALYEFIMKHCKPRVAAWDCGTGNGQVAMELSRYFQRIYASDISPNQIQNAYWDNKITYKVEAAEDCSFPDKSFNLIMVAQAIHWFDIEKFYAQVNRTLKPKGLLVIAGYGRVQVDESTDKVIQELYSDILGDYWDTDRIYIEQQYKTIPFPFKEIIAPEMFIESDWSLEQLLGYLGTWSSIQNKQNPIQKIEKKLTKAWGNSETKAISFPVFVRMGKKIPEASKK